MNKLILVGFSCFFISGCSFFSDEPKYNLDLKNSPCACMYDGEQPINNPSAEYRNFIYNEIKSMDVKNG